MKSFIFILSLFLSFPILAQNEGNIWYFGNNAGIDFNSGTPVALNNGALVTSEGCATISDPDGNLLFYTDGSIVYNANHVAMPNGLGLNGNSSSSQSAIIVKKPGSNTIYTVFTIAAQAEPNGFQYSEVDMTLDGGLGDVTSVKNVNVYSPTCEKITAISHGNGSAFWIVTLDYNAPNFRSYLLNDNGLATTWVSSPADLTVSSSVGTIGYIRTNISGTKLVLANTHGNNNVKLYDFNNTTGAITNPITLGLEDAYGLEFSPNGQYLYVSDLNSYPTSAYIYQYDLFAGNQTQTDIQNSETLVGQTFPSAAALQLGPDQKIYISKVGATNLSIIQSPNNQGTSCNFVDEGLMLLSGTSANYGLPTFYNNISDPTPSPSYDICQGDSITLSDPSFTTYNWALETSPATLISNDSNITVSPINSTTYLLYAGSDTIRFNVNVSEVLNLNLGPDICDAANTITLDATQPNLTYLWQDGSTDSIYEASSTGIYWVEITDGICTARDSIFLQFETINIEGDDVVYCDSTVALAVIDSNTKIGYWTYVSPPGGPLNVLFSPNNHVTNPIITVPELGEYSFIYTSFCGIADTHTVVFQSVPPVLNMNLTQACNFSINLNVSNPVQTGVWTAVGPEGETISIADINQPNTTAEVSNYGAYTFTYTYAFCEGSFSNTIDVQSIQPTITNTQNQYICDKEIILNAVVPGQAEQWTVKGPGIVTFDNFEALTTAANVSEYGDYTFYFSGCGGIDSFEVSFTQNSPTIHAPTFVECANEALVEVITLDNQSGVWSYKAGTDENITLTEIDDQTLSVTSDSYGEVELTYTTCDTSTSVTVIFMCELDIPNVFTPNSDGVNTDFFIRRLSPKFYDYSVFTVYNRWGIPVYTNGKYGLEGSWWNGKTSTKGENLPEGVYYYELDLHNKINNLNEVYKGSIHIFK